MNRFHGIALSMVIFTFAAGPAPAELNYPSSSPGPQLDTYHGVDVADPHRWMESLGSEQVKEWVAAQNGVARPFLEGHPLRQQLVERLTALWNYDQYSVPLRKGERYFFTEKRGLQNQAVLYWTDSLSAEPRVLLDPNQLAGDATIALAQYSISPKGTYVAYALSDGGTDWKTWRIREVASGKDLPEVLGLTKFTGVAWLPDESAFYYSRYPRKADGTGDDQQQVRVHLHRLGSEQEADPLVFEITDHPRRNPGAAVSDDGRWLVYTIFDGYERNAIYVQRLDVEDAPVQRLLDEWDGLYDFLGNDGDLLYFQTTQGAPRGRVVAIDPANASPTKWRVLIDEQDERLESASLVGGHFVAQYLKDAHSVVRIHRQDGSLRNEVKLPGAGSADGFPQNLTGSETFFAYTDYLTPRALYRYDVATDSVTPYRAPGVAFNPAPYVTEQVFYTSRDGTRVPMFITRRKDLELNGSNPVLLYGYGGFDISLTPGYSAAVAGWLELGGVYAVANLRGGGEYGAAWHMAGTKTRKQNVFDDFIAAAEWLIERKYTRPDRLAIMGRSNGGLLVGATLTQRPELFGAALPGVGVLDMLRYHTASANAYQWSSDYGTVEDPEQFKALAAYSPVHNTRKGQCYPPTLVTTAELDDRVVPWHSYKFAAALQRDQGCDQPVLIRIETRAGHGAGKPTWMQIEDWADQWSFVARHLGMADDPS
ncbi:MAG: prolyl oligopeptidase family serine peptidase [Steroidobacteraceae bacterium]